MARPGLQFASTLAKAHLVDGVPTWHDVDGSDRVEEVLEAAWAVLMGSSSITWAVLMGGSSEHGQQHGQF